jgi:hypothetical protein
MKLPNWFKIAWWAILTLIVTVFLYRRYPELIAGRAAAADVVVFLIWLALLLVPIFQEVTLLGITLKQDIEDLKRNVTNQITSLRAELSNAVDVRTNFSPQINFPAPPPDSQLPALEERVKAAVSEAVQGLNRKQLSLPSEEMPVHSDVQFLFATRLHIEKELRRIARERDLHDVARRGSTMQLTRALVTAQVIEPSLEKAIREVYAVCSPAVHGEDVTAAQVRFVRDVAPSLLAALKAIS